MATTLKMFTDRFRDIYDRLTQPVPEALWRIAEVSRLVSEVTAECTDWLQQVLDAVTRPNVSPSIPVAPEKNETDPDAIVPVDPKPIAKTKKQKKQEKIAAELEESSTEIFDPDLFKVHNHELALVAAATSKLAKVGPAKYVSTARDNPTSNLTAAQIVVLSKLLLVTLEAIREKTALIESGL